MARQGVTVVYLCYEHDEVTLLTRLLSCELGEIVGAEPSTPHRDELQARLRDLGTGTVTFAEVVASDPLLDQAGRRLAASPGAPYRPAQLV